MNRHTPAILALAFLAGIHALAAELPADLQDELDALHEKLVAVEKQIGKFSADKVEQSLAEAKDWIDEFAINAELFDDDPIVVALRMRLAELVDRASKAGKEAMKPAVPSPAAKTASQKLDELLKIEVNLKNVSFKRDVAPIIAESCLGCHNANRTSGDFNAGTFATFIEHVVPGNPDESHVLNLVTGKSQPRMPRGGGGFSKEAVDVWTAWVQQGAKFDGPSEDAAITSYLVDGDAQRREKIRGLSSFDLEELHALAAQRQIDLVAPQRPVHSFQTQNFLVHTTLDKADAEYVAVLGEAILEELGPRYSRGREEAVWPGRLGLVVFRDRYDYVAFAKQVDNYSPEDFEFGHSRFRPEHQYVGMTTQVANASLDQLVAEQVIAAFYRSLGQGKMPDWAVHGLSRAMSTDWDPAGAPSVREDLRRSAELASQGRTLADMAGGKLPWGETSALSVGFFAFLSSTKPKEWDAFVTLLANGASADQAAAKSLSSSLASLTHGWRDWLDKKHRRKR